MKSISQARHMKSKSVRVSRLFDLEMTGFDNSRAAVEDADGEEVSTKEAQDWAEGAESEAEGGAKESEYGAEGADGNSEGAEGRAEGADDEGAEAEGGDERAEERAEEAQGVAEGAGETVGGTEEERWAKGAEAVAAEGGAEGPAGGAAPVWAEQVAEEALQAVSPSLEGLARMWCRKTCSWWVLVSLAVKLGHNPHV